MEFSPRYRLWSIRSKILNAITHPIVESVSAEAWPAPVKELSGAQPHDTALRPQPREGGAEEGKRDEPSLKEAIHPSAKLEIAENPAVEERLAAEEFLKEKSVVTRLGGVEPVRENIVEDVEEIVEVEEVNDKVATPMMSTRPDQDKVSGNNLFERDRVEVLQPGLVLIPNFISETQQRNLAIQAIAMGESNNGSTTGFFETDPITGRRVMNAENGRGRIYDAATKFPKGTICHSTDAVQIARDVDPAMPEMNCTHLLLNMYTSNAGLIWHRDIYENDGKSDHPVVNVCVGASCKFGVRLDNGEEKVLALHSGDCLVFGGPSRAIEHAVLEVNLDDTPNWMDKIMKPCRFSFTFRDSPEVIGREEEFKFFKVAEHLVGQEDFELPPDRKNFKRLPSLRTQQLTTYDLTIKRKEK